MTENKKLRERMGIKLPDHIQMSQNFFSSMQMEEIYRELYERSQSEESLTPTQKFFYEIDGYCRELARKLIVLREVIENRPIKKYAVLNSIYISMIFHYLVLMTANSEGTVDGMLKTAKQLMNAVELHQKDVVSKAMSLPSYRRSKIINKTLIVNIIKTAMIYAGVYPVNKQKNR